MTSARDILVWWLAKEQLQSTRPTLTATSLASFLVTGFTPTTFFYGVNAPTNFVGYSGTVALVNDASPVPESMSLLFVGSGLSAIGARLWRRNTQ